ncbi:type VII secretion protein EccB [Microbacterium sp.]|uniref:type VII secretion protein EccB n=1 Tax=Microbacterium sp. TaxID=51671 RepID=UPI003A8B0FC8
MATKKDLIEAQGFSRGRLLSAFLGGAPGGKELQPARPLRAVIAGVALTAMVVLAGVFTGLLQPGLPGGWENNHLIVAKDTGARYVSIEGTLYPVINATSARMVIPEGEFQIISVNQSSLDGVPVGGTIGILGAPDTLPAPANLDGERWRACSSATGTDVTLGGAAGRSAPEGTGVVVVRDGETFVISGGVSYRVPGDNPTAVLRALGLDAAERFTVRGEWLSLFRRGDDLVPLRLMNTKSSLADLDLPTGTIVHVAGSPEDERYVLTADGALAPLSPLAHRLYLLGTGAGELGETVELSPADIADLATRSALGRTTWPREPLTPLEDLRSPCARLTGDRSEQTTVLAAARDEPDVENTDGAIRITMPEDGGALVRGGRAGTLTLIDGSGTAFAVPGEVDAGVAHLGYSPDDVTVVPPEWLMLLPAGPELTPDAAGSTPGSTL